MLLIVILLFFCSFFALSYVLSPSIVDYVVDANLRRSRVLEEKMDRMFMRPQRQKVYLIYPLSAFLFGGTGWLFSPPELKIVGLLIGLTFGIVVPGFVIGILEEKRRNKFDDQLIDTIMIMSSSLKGGLSLIQAMEVVVEEMPEPVNQEFGILLGENKMGVSLEDSFAHLHQRVPSLPLQQVITTILLARETGGNLPFIFSRIVTTIREHRKLMQNLSNLTLQGKIQGFVMSVLPIAFAFIVLSTNPRYFEAMLNTDIGRLLLTYAFFSELVGIFIIWKISSFKDF